MLPGRTTPLRRGQKRSLRGGGEDHDQTLSTKPPTTPQLTPGAGLATCGPATGVASGDHTRPTSLAGGSWPAPPAPPRPASSRPDGSTAPPNAPRPQRRERGPAWASAASPPNAAQRADAGPQKPQQTPSACGLCTSIQRGPHGSCSGNSSSTARRGGPRRPVDSGCLPPAALQQASFSK